MNNLQKITLIFRVENDNTSNKLNRERELSMELASTVSRLKDQVQIQMENFTKIETPSADLKRKNKDAQAGFEKL